MISQIYLSHYKLAIQKSLRPLFSPFPIGLGYKKSEGKTPPLFSLMNNAVIYCLLPLDSLSRSKTRLKRNVFDNGLRLTPLPDGIR